MQSNLLSDEIKLIQNKIYQNQLWKNLKTTERNETVLTFPSTVKFFSVASFIPSINITPSEVSKLW